MLDNREEQEMVASPASPPPRRLPAVCLLPSQEKKAVRGKIWCYGGTEVSEEERQERQAR